MKNTKYSRLKLMPRENYVVLDEYDPLRFYYWPVLGSMYKKRVEYCLSACSGGHRVLDIGFGSGVNFLNLNDIYDEIHGLDLLSDITKVGKVFTDVDIHPQLKNGNVLDMPYPDDFFDTVLLVSILEHIKPDEQLKAFQEINRVLKPGGQVVYGVPVERKLMELVFWFLRANIRDHHFSTEKDVSSTADKVLARVRITPMKSFIPWLGAVYEVGHYKKPGV